jgi:membrane associated rhomboid family serine protease
MTDQFVQREPIFNIPRVIVVMLAVMASIHAVRLFVLTPAQDNDLLWLFAFDPIRYGGLPVGTLPGGFGAQVWTFVTYAFLHASWTHLGVNAVWFLAFGSAVARRFGAVRFLIFFCVTAAAGANAHLFAFGGQDAPVIGASAAISGTMAAAMRFAFQRGGPLTFRRSFGDAAYRMPAMPLARALREPAVIAFLVVWFGMNFLFGLWSTPLTGENEVVAWQAHIGGFLAGLLLFAWFDPPADFQQFDGDAATPH